MAFTAYYRIFKEFAMLFDAAPVAAPPLAAKRPRRVSLGLLPLLFLVVLAGHAGRVMADDDPVCTAYPVTFSFNPLTQDVGDPPEERQPLNQWIDAKSSKDSAAFMWCQKDSWPHSLYVTISTTTNTAGSFPGGYTIFMTNNASVGYIMEYHFTNAISYHRWQPVSIGKSHELAATFTCSSAGCGPTVNLRYKFIWLEKDIFANTGSIAISPEALPDIFTFSEENPLKQSQQSSGSMDATASTSLRYSNPTCIFTSGTNNNSQDENQLDVNIKMLDMLANATKGEKQSQSFRFTPSQCIGMQHIVFTIGTSNGKNYFEVNNSQNKPVNNLQLTISSPTPVKPGDTVELLKNQATDFTATFQKTDDKPLVPDTYSVDIPVTVNYK